jgi:putative FmdB family regulatory protein
MPTYEYLCSKCKHRFEESQSITAPSLTECPKCKGSLQRVIGNSVGIVFKGSGFHITDYTDRKSKHEDPAGKDTKAKK